MDQSTWKRVRRWLRDYAEPTILWTSRVLLIAIAIWLGYVHAFPMQLHADNTDYPVIDVVTLGLIGVGIIALFLPKISEVTLGGASIKLRSAEAAADEVKDVAEDLANLAQNWSTSIGILAVALRATKDGKEQDRLLAQHLRDRMGEAVHYLTADPDDKARIMFWVFDKDTNALDLVYGTDTPTKTSYVVGEGMIGKSFEEGRPFNEADVRALPCYVNTRGTEPPYRAVLAQPVMLGSEKTGMLTVDKRADEIYGHIALEIAKGLSAQCTIAVDLWQLA